MSHIPKIVVFWGSIMTIERSKNFKLLSRHHRQQHYRWSTLYVFTIPDKWPRDNRHTPWWKSHFKTVVHFAHSFRWAFISYILPCTMSLKYSHSLLDFGHEHHNIHLLIKEWGLSQSHGWLWHDSICILNKCQRIAQSLTDCRLEL